MNDQQNEVKQSHLNNREKNNRDIKDFHLYYAKNPERITQLPHISNFADNHGYSKISHEDVKSNQTIQPESPPIVGDVPDSHNFPFKQDKKTHHLDIIQQKKEILQFTKWVDHLHQAYEVLKNSRKEHHTLDSIKVFNENANVFNEVFLESSAARIASINSMISEYNASRQQGEPALRKLALPPKMRLLNETHSQSEPSFSKANLANLVKTVGIGYLALSSSMAGLVSAQPTHALAQVNGDTSLREPMHLDHLVSLPEVQDKNLLIPRRPEYRRLERRDNSDILSGIKLVSQTDIAKVYINGTSSDIINAVKVFPQAIETCNEFLTDTFGLKPNGLPFTFYLMSDAGHEAKAFHSQCSDTTIFASTKYGAQASVGLALSEMVEVYEAAINNGWDCDHTNGEALSRALAIELYPKELGPLSLTDQAQSWFHNGAHDFISTNHATDGDFDANGCGTLFLYYLHDGLRKDWKTIVAAGGSTLAKTYSKLTGKDPSTAFPNFKKALKPFIVKFGHRKWLILPKIGESWASQARKRKMIEGSVKGGIGGIIGGTLVASGYYLWRRRRQQRTHTDTSSQQQIELQGNNPREADLA